MLYHNGSAKMEKNNFEFRHSRSYYSYEVTLRSSLALSLPRVCTDYRSGASVTDNDWIFLFRVNLSFKSLCDLRCRVEIKLHILLSVTSLSLQLSSSAGQTVAAPGCVFHFYESVCVYVQLADPRSPVRLLWVFTSLILSGFWGLVFLFRGEGSLQQLQGSGSGCAAEESQPSGVSFSPSARLCATICGEWKGVATPTRLLIKRLMRQSQGWAV